MSNDETALVENKKLDQPIEISEGGVVLHNLNDVWGYARGIIAAKMHPNSLDTVDKVAIAILTGAEVGWKPMLSVRSLAVINGVPGWTTAAARALVQDSGQLKPGTSIQEGVIHADGCQHEKEGKRCIDGCYGYCCTHHREHAVEREVKFSVADAKQAKLWNDPERDPWQKYPTRMLMHRAAGFHFRDCWGAVLNGLDLAEVVADYPPAAFVKEGDTVATYTKPPGLDPLLARGSVKDEGAGEPVEGAIVGEDGGDGTSASSEPEAPEVPAPSEPEPENEPDTVKCEACPRTFSRSHEAHWPYGDGAYRCAECGPREKIGDDA